MRLTHDSGTYSEFYTDATGDLSILLTDNNGGGDDIRILDENLWICSGGSFGSPDCPSVNLPETTGNLVVAGKIYEDTIALGACDGINTVYDIDGNKYSTVVIGDQCWMTENMRTTHNPAGIAITRYCYNDISANCDTDGGLYTWGTAMSDGGPQGICPDGWHIPTDAEYTILTNYLGSNPGDKMKTIDKCSPGGTDCGTDCGTSGFNGLLAGLKSSDECTYYHFGTYTFLWSSTQNEGNAWDRRLSSGYSHVGRECSSKEYGCSVRCIRDY